MSSSRGLRLAHSKEPEMGDDNPNMVRVGDPLEKDIRRLTYLVPNHELDPSDVFIVGYMKSGTTWFRNLTAGVVYGLNSEYAGATWWCPWRTT
jgi:hypothetical protein